MWIREYAASVWHWYAIDRLSRTICGIDNINPTRISEVSEEVPQRGYCAVCEELRNKSIREKGEQKMNEKKRPEFVVGEPEEKPSPTVFELVNYQTRIDLRVSNVGVGPSAYYTVLSIWKETGRMSLYENVAEGLGLELDSAGRIVIKGL